MHSSDEPEEVTRRGFLQRAGTGVLAAGLAGAVVGEAGAQEEAARAQGQQMPQITQPPPEPPDRRVGWAVVGLGKFAVNQILPSFGECRRSRLAALVSGSPDKARQLARQYGVPEKSVYGYDNFDALRDNPEVQVVYVILPNALHGEYTIRAARAGKHVLCEKPMAPTVAECEQMIAACRQADRKLMIAYRAQYEPYNREAIRLCRGGELGRLKIITSDHGRIADPSDPADRWRLNRELSGGGSLPDIGIYALNATRYLTGEEPIEVSARIFSTPGDPRFREVEESVVFTLRFPSGVLASCTSSYGYAETKRIQVFGDKAALTLDPATDYYQHRLFLERRQKQGEQEVPVREDRSLPEKNQFAAEMDHLSECVLENRAPRTPGEEGLQDVRIIQAIYAAARTGRPVSLPRMAPPRNERNGIA